MNDAITTDHLLANETLLDEFDEWGESLPYHITLGDIPDDVNNSFDDPVYKQMGPMVDAMFDGLQLSPKTTSTISHRRELEKETLRKNGWTRYPISTSKQPRFKYVNQYTKEEVTALQEALSKCPKRKRS